MDLRQTYDMTLVISGGALNSENLVENAVDPPVVGRRTIVKFWYLTRPDQRNIGEGDLVDIYIGDGSCINADLAFERCRNNIDRHYAAPDRTSVNGRRVLCSSSCCCFCP